MPRASIWPPLPNLAASPYRASCSTLASKPSGVAFADAASLPCAAGTDLDALTFVGAPWSATSNFTAVLI